MDTTVVTLAPREIGKAARLLSFRSVLDELLPNVWRTSGFEAVAAWVPPGFEPSAGLRGRVNGRFLRTLCPASRQLLAGFDTLGELHPHQPHWYLAFVGVEPSRQGRGFGSRLLAPALAEADAGATLSYLETPFPNTRRFYERLGFEVVSEVPAFAGAPPVWTMLREPR